MDIFDFSYKFPSTIEELDNYSGKQFEVFLFEFFKVLSYSPILTDDTNDKGIDLIITIPKGEKRVNVGIQAKRWKSKVGVTEIRSMLEGKKHYRLDEVWIITTSDLTSAAITSAKNNEIEILNRERVKLFLEELKKYPNVKFLQQSPSKKSTISDNKNVVNSNLSQKLKELRLLLSIKHTIIPIYLVFNNSTIDDLISKLPATKEELLQVKGFSPRRVELYGDDVLVLTIEEKERINYNKTELIKIRDRIVKFNKLNSINDVFDDETLHIIATELPTTITDLKKLSGLSEKKINLFGEYLVRKLIDIKKSML